MLDRFTIGSASTHTNPRQLTSMILVLAADADAYESFARTVAADVGTLDLRLVPEWLDDSPTVPRRYIELIAQHIVPPIRYVRLDRAPIPEWLYGLLFEDAWKQGHAWVLSGQSGVPEGSTTEKRHGGPPRDRERIANDPLVQRIIHGVPVLDPALRIEANVDHEADVNETDHPITGARP